MCTFSYDTYAFLGPAHRIPFITINDVEKFQSEAFDWQHFIQTEIIFIFSASYFMIRSDNFSKLFQMTGISKTISTFLNYAKKIYFSFKLILNLPCLIQPSLCIVSVRGLFLPGKFQLILFSHELRFSASFPLVFVVSAGHSVPVFAWHIPSFGQCYKDSSQDRLLLLPFSEKEK